jgi:hypothetical protein
MYLHFSTKRFDASHEAFSFPCGGILEAIFVAPVVGVQLLHCLLDLILGLA